eukprot:495483_1
MDLNLYKMCFCMKQVIKYQYEWSKCMCCCNEYDENEMEFYCCDRGTECEYDKISAVTYMTCSTCFNKGYDGTYDGQNDFISTKTKANIKIISEEMKKLNDIQQRKKYMYRIYFSLYKYWIAKLNDDELTKHFNDFYHKELEKKK